MQWVAYEAWSAYGAEVPLAVPAEDAEQVGFGPVACRGRVLLTCIAAAPAMCPLWLNKIAASTQCNTQNFNQELLLYNRKLRKYVHMNSLNCCLHAHLHFVTHSPSQLLLVSADYTVLCTISFRAAAV